MHLSCHLLECERRLCLALGLEGVAPLPSLPAVLLRRLTRLGEADERHRAKADFCSLAPGDDALHPSPCAVGVDPEEGPVTVGLLAEGLYSSNECGRQRLLRMLSRFYTRPPVLTVRHRVLYSCLEYGDVAGAHKRRMRCKLLYFMRCRNGLE